jgi:nitric oxide reductase NorD protein
MPSTPSFFDTRLLPLWQQLDCRLAGVEDVFEGFAGPALSLLNEVQLQAYIETARAMGKLGRGTEPLLAWLEFWPDIAVCGTQDVHGNVMDLVRQMHTSSNGAAIRPLLETLLPVAHQLASDQSLLQYLRLVADFMHQTTRSVHGRQRSRESPGLINLLKHAPVLLHDLTLDGLENWTHYGARAYGTHPQQQADYFALLTPDSRAVRLRERKGLLLQDADRSLGLALRCMWQLPHGRTPLSSSTSPLRVRPCLQDQTIGLPDALDTCAGIDPKSRYHLMQAHLAAHVQWSSACIADNWSPAQRLAVEWFEDARVDTLMLRRFPGLGPTLLALHPIPDPNECNDVTQACLRHRLCRWSRSVFDPTYVPQDLVLERYRQSFLEALRDRESNTSEIAGLALQFVVHTRRSSDNLPDVYFGNTDLDWRDDNRHLWRFIENGDEEETHSSAQSPADDTSTTDLPPRLYPEWDYLAQNYRPDWVSVYEHLHPSGQATDTDALLARHPALATRLRRAIDRLKPQGRARLRFQEQGNELDLDLALGAWIDLQMGQTPSTYVHQHHQTCTRDISIHVLLDLSASLQTRVAGQDQTVMELSQEAVALLAWAMNELGDPFAVSGFHSNTRHAVRYFHIKGFSEPWGDAPKARLAALAPSYSTRMGAALRHAAHYLGARQSEKKLMLVITDGEPSDVDCPDEKWLVHDTRKAVQALQAQGIFTWCINLDPTCDETVRSIYGSRYTIVDHLAKLPDSLAQLFLNLTGKQH